MHCASLLVSSILFINVVYGHPHGSDNETPIVTDDSGNVSIDPMCGMYLNEDSCHLAKKQDNLPCYWNSTESECISINCLNFNNVCNCMEFQNDYGCQWYGIEHTLFGNIDTCYSDCASSLDLIFLIDVSSSMMNIDNIGSFISDYIITTMVFWWNVQKQRFIISSVHDTTRFGIILYSNENVGYLDLEYGWDLNNYIKKVEKIFNKNGYLNSLFGNNDTNILNALNAAYEMFDRASDNSDSNDNIKRLAVLITDGESTLPSHDPHPCSIYNNIAKKYFDGINGDSIEFFGALIGDSLSKVELSCFNEYGGNIVEVSNYDNNMNNYIPGIYNSKPSLLCNNDDIPTTAQPTDEPTAIYKIETSEPTKEPRVTWWSDKTPHPTSNPSISPSFPPTLIPTLIPTSIPTPYPTWKDTTTTSEPTMKPTKHTWWTRHTTTTTTTSTTTGAPSKEPSNEPSKEPSKVPTNEPTKYPTWKMDPTRTTSTTTSTNKPTMTPVWTAKPTHSTTTTSTTNEPSMVPTMEPTIEITPKPTKHTWWIGHSSSTSTTSTTTSTSTTNKPTMTPSDDATTTSTTTTMEPSKEPTNKPTKHTWWTSHSSSTTTTTLEPTTLEPTTPAPTTRAPTTSAPTFEPSLSSTTTTTTSTTTQQPTNKPTKHTWWTSHSSSTTTTTPEPTETTYSTSSTTTTKEPTPEPTKRGGSWWTNKGN